ncbi:glycosyltransferase [Sphingomonas sp. TDK1]|uniref:glycosyltransferase n=1 Tax=Sphingomonas sp. TDK1 TaxID=453247 RepID=UPI0009FE3F19|nr:glycosyltransferase family 2 protein [Sphingomonas sp. TDK1]
MTRLALVMIVKNEARCLARCLESVRGHVDRMIVLDTGSTDDTVAIAQRLGAEVHAFPWCDDFAAARNAALDHSDADWNLILDADEWLESGAAALGATTLPSLGGAPAAFLGCVHLVNAGRREEDPGQRILLPRLLPRGVRYQGRVHEQPDSGLPLHPLDIVVGHDGYVPDQLAAKRGRNEALLHAALEANPEDGAMWYQLGRELFAYDDIAGALDAMLHAYRFVAPDSIERLSVVIYTVLLLRLAKRHEEALALVDAEQDRWEHAPDFFFAVAELYLEWASLNLEIAQEELLPVVEAAWLKCLQIGERPGLAVTFEGSGSYRAAQNLANFYKVLGFADEAAHYAKLSGEMRAAARAA